MADARAEGYRITTVLFLCRGGGTGRRASLRSWCPQGHEGSTPSHDTKNLKTYEANSSSNFDSKSSIAC